MDSLLRKVMLCSCAGAVCLLTACGPRGQGADELKHPAILKIAKLKQDNDIPGAIAVGEKAVLKYPGLTRTQLELAYLYEMQSNHLRSIYHYQRYLEMNPQTKTRDLIEERIAENQAAYIKSLPGDMPPLVQDAKRLQRDNDVLREKIAEMQTQLNDFERAAGRGGDPAAVKPVRPPPEAGKGRAPAVTPATGRVYKVKKNDNLKKIAAAAYGDAAAWKRIFEANRDLLPNPSALKEGQVLKLPVSDGMTTNTAGKAKP